MRVALLGPCPADGRLQGGVDAVVRTLALGLAAQPDLDVHVITAVPGLRQSRNALDGALTHHEVPHPAGDRMLWHRPLVRSLLDAIARLRPDIVHAHMAGPYADAALRGGYPAVITLHGILQREVHLAEADGAGAAARLRMRLDCLYEQAVLRRARDVIAISPYVLEAYRSLTPARFHQIENPVAESYFAAGPLPLPGRRILCVARVIPRKDILTLLNAFAVVHTDLEDAELDVVGQLDADPAYAERCQNVSRQLGLEKHVHFRGGLHGEQLLAAYSAANVVALTSRQETAPVVIAEAMAAGRPVVATRVGGLAHMVEEDRTALLAQPGDTRTLGTAMLALLADPGRQQEMGARARALAMERYALPAIVARTLALYAALGRSPVQA